MDIYAGINRWLVVASLATGALTTGALSTTATAQEGNDAIEEIIVVATRREESVQDIGALLDWIETQDDMDAERVGVIGGSYGGYMVLATMTHYNDRIRAAVELFGISNHFFDRLASSADRF